MGRAFVVAALAAVVIGGLVLVCIIIKLVRENARQREAAARPEAWPPVPRERERPREREPERSRDRPARRQAALMTQEYPAVDAQSVPQRLPGAEPQAPAQSGPIRVARA